MSSTPLLLNQDWDVLLAQMLECGMENYSMGLFTNAGWGGEQVRVMIARVRSEITDPKVHSFTRAWCITGQKRSEFDNTDIEIPSGNMCREYLSLIAEPDILERHMTTI